MRKRVLKKKKIFEKEKNYLKKKMSIKKALILSIEKDDDDHSVEDLLQDLEKAIQKRGDSSHLLHEIDDNFELNRSFDQGKNKKKIDDDDNEDEFDEDFVLKEIEFCESDEEMKELSEIEESKLLFSNENAYKFLYRKSVRKSFIMMKIIKKFLTITNSEDHKKLKENYREMNRKFDAQLKENLALRKEKNELISQNTEQNYKMKKISHKFEELNSELNLYKGDTKALKNLDFETIANIERKFNESIRNINEFKTNVNKINLIFIEISQI